MSNVLATYFNSYLKKGKGSLKAFLLVVTLSTFTLHLYADDPGIAKVRLIQLSDTTYVFEVDIPQAFLGSFQAPVLPPGFSITTPTREFQSGWVTLKANITSSSKQFHPEDIIVLPWARNAVDITAQWLDGKTYKGFFPRTLNGIHVPLNQIMSVQKSTKEILKDHFLSGLDHFTFKWIHLLLVLTLVAAAPSRKVFGLLLAFSIGQMGSMLFMEMQIFAFDLLFADLILLVFILFVSHFLIRSKVPENLPLLVFVAALIHGMAFGNELRSENLLLEQRIQAMFAFNLGIDLGNFVFGALLIFLSPFIKKTRLQIPALPLFTGSVAVFLVFLVFDGNILANKKQILDFQRSRKQMIVQANAGATSNEAVTRSQGLMTSPIMVFLSVEPYETRKEILLSGKEVVHILGLEKNESNTFPIEQQNQIKKELELLLEASDTTFINGNKIEAENIAANFVTLGKGGVSIKENSVEEYVDEAIIGISLNYLTPNFPDSIHFDWHIFPRTEEIDLSLVDPHATFAGVLNPTSNAVKWESRIKGFTLPAIEPIEVKNEPIPVVSYSLWIILIIGFILLRFSRRELIYNPKIKNGALAVFLIGLLLFPFARPALGISALTHGKPSQEKGALILSDLLNNVYRAFDRKQEDEVYDRLAMSVSDEQLTEIYLQNRQSMALENRGRARATVDEVIITQLYGIEKKESGKYIADVEWTVRGSVNHFGHTHYRQNRYRALVTFVIDNNYWKISKIEILDARRLY